MHTRVFGTQLCKYQCRHTLSNKLFFFPRLSRRKRGWLPILFVSAHYYFLLLSFLCWIFFSPLLRFMSCQQLPVNVSWHSLATVCEHMFGGFIGETYVPVCLRVVQQQDQKTADSKPTLLEWDCFGLEDGWLWEIYIVGCNWLLLVEGNHHQVKFLIWQWSQVLNVPEKAYMCVCLCVWTKYGEPPSELHIVSPISSFLFFFFTNHFVLLRSLHLPALLPSNPAGAQDNLASKEFYYAADRDGDKYWLKKNARQFRETKQPGWILFP